MFLRRSVRRKAKSTFIKTGLAAVYVIAVLSVAKILLPIRDQDDTDFTIPEFVMPSLPPIDQENAVGEFKHGVNSNQNAIVESKKTLPELEPHPKNAIFESKPKESKKTLPKLEPHAIKSRSASASLAKLGTVLPIPMNVNWTKFFVNNRKLCYPSEEVALSSDTSLDPNKFKRNLLLVMVQSTREHFLKRESIRRTYGSLRNYNGWDIRTIFLLGKGPSKENMDKGNFDFSRMFDNIRLTWEIESHWDIIMGPFHESPQHSCNVFKHVMGYRWASSVCVQASFVVKVDDDHFVDVMEVIDQSIPKLKANGGSFYCSRRLGKLTQGKISAEESKKLGLSKDTDTDLALKGPQELQIMNADGPDETSYCAGEAYLVDATVIPKLYEMVPEVPFFMEKGLLENDDLFVTGRLREAYLNINPKESLKIVHHEHLFHHDMDKCSYLSDEMEVNRQGSGRRMPFRKIPTTGSSISDIWCWWKEALQVKDMLKGMQKRRFLLSSMTM